VNVPGTVPGTSKVPTKPTSSVAHGPRTEQTPPQPPPHAVTRCTGNVYEGVAPENWTVTGENIFVRPASPMAKFGLALLTTIVAQKVEDGSRWCLGVGVGVGEPENG
jgi:hypothetical protein